MSLADLRSPSVRSAGVVLLLLAAVLLAGCETVVEVHLPDHEPRMVVNSVFSPGQPWFVRVSRSADIFKEARPVTIPDARVEIWEEEQLLAVLSHLGDGNYGTDAVMPVAGRTYTVRASAPGLPDVEARSTTPDDIRISVSTRSLPEGSHGFDFPLEIALSIQDPPGERNYYRFSINGIFEHQGQRYVRTIAFKPLDRSIVDLQVDVDPFGSEVYNYILFGDAHFDGEEYDLKVVIPSDHSSRAEELSLEVSFLTEEYARYQRSVDLQRMTSDNPFAESVQVYSNVTNGLGIFAGINSKRLEVSVP